MLPYSIPSSKKMNHSVLSGYCLFGSTGSHSLKQPSSFVGKSTIAQLLRPAGFVTCSHADEIRLVVTGNDYFGDLLRRNNEPRPIEGPEVKKKLIRVGESFNAIERNGWAILAALKMMLLDTATIYKNEKRCFVSEHRGFVVDDVRRPNEILLLSFLGLNPIEIRRVDNQAREYDSDGRLGGIGRVEYNNGTPGELERIAESYCGWKGDAFRRLQNLNQNEYHTGILRMFFHQLSPDTRVLFRANPDVRYYFSDEMKKAQPDEALALRDIVIQHMIDTIRTRANDHAIGLFGGLPWAS